MDAADGAASKDPEVGLRAVAALRHLADRLEELQVQNARSQGWTWQQIADRLGVSKQAVHKKHAHGGPIRAFAKELAAIGASLRETLPRKE